MIASPAILHTTFSTSITHFRQHTVTSFDSYGREISWFTLILCKFFRLIPCPVPTRTSFKCQDKYANWLLTPPLADRIFNSSQPRGNIMPERADSTLNLGINTNVRRQTAQLYANLFYFLTCRLIRFFPSFF